MKWTRIGRTDENPAGIARYIDTVSDVYIWCHGTSGKRQWRHNFQTRTVKWCGFRVNRKDLEQARQIIDILISEKRIPLPAVRLHLYGFSRGGAGAVLLSIIYAVEPEALIAPKRAGIGLPTYEARHWRGDIVPFLPLRYTAYDTQHYTPRWYWPWDAHKRAAHHAALLRHSISRRT